MISTNIYYLACILKQTQIFALLIKNLEYQAEKKAKIEIDLKIIILEEFHNFFDLFLIKKFDIFFFIKNTTIKLN